MRRGWRRILLPESWIWLALVVLLGVNLGLAFLLPSGAQIVAALLVALAMASLVALLFMDLDRATSTLRIAAGAGPFFLAILLVLVFADILTR